MDVRQAELADLQFRRALGQDVSDHLIAWAKRGYVDGVLSIEALESTVGAILSGDPVAILEPGEWVFPLGRRVP